MRVGIRRVAVGVSGGVDSAVSTLLLKRKGFDVVGVFMQNWDGNDETGNCTVEQDFEYAERVCVRLGVPLTRVNFVKEYWNDVFSNLLNDYETGYTPNPDIRCNEFIKFRTFYDYARNQLAADAVATGHYANTTFGPYLENFKPDTTLFLCIVFFPDASLLKAIDTFKDQTFFLSRIPQDSLRRVMFPVGQYLKNEVIKIARENGLGDVARKKESMGICFIGSRHFPDFISEYVENRPGNFIDLDTGAVVGKHNGIHHWTLGQRCKIGGLPKPYFVYHKDRQSNDIHVVRGTNHPALYSDLILTDKMHWINPFWADPMNFRGASDCDFRFQHTHKLVPCTTFKTVDDRLIIRLEKPARALTPGQFAVLYLKNECLGGARILNAGPSYYSLNKNSEAILKEDYNNSEDDQDNRIRLAQRHIE